MDSAFDPWELAGGPKGVVVTKLVVDDTADPPRLSADIELHVLPGWKVKVGADGTRAGIVLDTLSIHWTGAPDARPPGGLTSSLLKRVRVGLILDALRFEAESQAMARNEVEYLQGTAQPGTRRGQRPHDSDTLRYIAELRLSAEESDSPRPNRDIAAFLKETADLRPDTDLAGTTAYVASLVGKATKAGWLHESGPGRRTRIPGPLLLAAWEREAAQTDTTEPTERDNDR